MTIVSNTVGYINVRSYLAAAVCAALLCTSACARFLPADPYKNTQTVKVLDVPEGKQRPAVDPSLAVPEGDSTWTDKGHMPPAVASAQTAKPEMMPEKMPEVIEKTEADQ